MELAVDEQIARISQRIRRWREDDALTLQELAERGGLATSFGHLGANGSCAWADPTRALSVAFIRNEGLRNRFPYFQTAKISGIALRCAQVRDGERG